MSKSVLTSKSALVAGLAGSMVLASAWMARAQDAAAQQSAQAQPAQAQPVQTQPQQPAPVQFRCATLGCLFSGSEAQPPAEPPQQAEQAQAYEGPPGDAVGVTKPRPKPIHTVTIAATASEAVRLKGLVSAMPKDKVKVVAQTAAGEADFSVSTSLDEHGAGEKAKLFTEQMHIVAGGRIQSISDLTGKVVSFGPDKSAGQAAARKAFEALNISVKDTPLDLDNALDGLSTGDVDAVVIVAPQPFARLASLSTPGLHLLSWPQDGALPTGAVESSIDPAHYPGLARPDASIRAVGVDAILKISAKGEHEPACKTFLTSLAQHSAALSKHGFDLLKADLDTRNGRHFASAETR